MSIMTTPVGIIHMLVDVSQLVKESIGTTWRYGFRWFAEPPVHGEFTLLRTDKGVLVSGTVETAVEAVCSRCLAPTMQQVEVSIAEEFCHDAEEDGFVISAEGEIDLGEAVRQYVVLATPMKPLCRRDCAGLCATCGKNLNLGPCDCPPREVDPRLAKLAALVIEKEG